MESNICDPIIDESASMHVSIIGDNTNHSIMEDENNNNRIESKSMYFDNTYEWKYFGKNRNTELSAYFIPQHKIIFCGIPKNAISMWKMVLLRLHDDNVKEWWLPSIAKIHDWGNGLQQYRLHHLNFTQVSKWMNDPSWYKAVFIRDPLERALSGIMNKGRIIGNIEWGVSFIQYLSNTSVDSKKGKHLIDQHIRPQYTFCDLYKWIDKYHIFSYHNKLDKKRFLDDNGLWDKYGSNGWSPNDHPKMNTDGIVYNLTEFGNVFKGHGRKTIVQLLQKYNVKLVSFLLGYYQYDYILFNLKIPEWICGVIDKDWKSMIKLMGAFIKTGPQHRRKEEVMQSCTLYKDLVDLYTTLDRFPSHLQPECMDIITSCVKYGDCPMEFGYDVDNLQKIMKAQEIIEYKKPITIKKMKKNGTIHKN